MATAAKSGINVKFKRQHDSTTGVYVDQAEARRISGPTMTRDFIDATNLDSTSGFREFVNGFRDGGEVRVQFNYTKAVFDQLNTDFLVDTSHVYQIVIPATGNTLEFNAFITQLPLDITPDGVIVIDSVFKVSGSVTVT